MKKIHADFWSSNAENLELAIAYYELETGDSTTLENGMVEDVDTVLQKLATLEKCNDLIADFCKSSIAAVGVVSNYNYSRLAL